MTFRLLLGLGLVLLTVPAAGQAVAIAGTVLDETGAVVPGAGVMLTGRTRESRYTDPRGGIDSTTSPRDLPGVDPALGIRPRHARRPRRGRRGCLVPPITLGVAGTAKRWSSCVRVESTPSMPPRR